MRHSLLLFFLLVAGKSVLAQDLQLYEKQLFIQQEDTLPCRILSPLNFLDHKKYPLVIFLHGSGERGNDNGSQLRWGGDLFLDSLNREKFPAFVLFPQCPADSIWSLEKRNPVKDSLGGLVFGIDAPAKKPLQLLMDFIDTLVKSGRVDPNRIYVGGLSLGGYAVFELLWRRPDLFAAAFPICGGGNTEGVKRYAKGIPIWVFHGSEDLSVPVANSRVMVAALRAAKARVKYSEYPGVGHDSWKNAFAEPDLLPWIFNNRKK